MRRVKVESFVFPTVLGALRRLALTDRRSLSSYIARVLQIHVETHDPSLRSLVSRGRDPYKNDLTKGG